MVNEGIAIKPASEAFVEIERKEVGQLLEIARTNLWIVFKI